MNGCQTCGVALLPNRGPGRARKFCSDRCRKRQYDLSCVDCGGRADGTSPGKMHNPEEPVCSSCAGTHYATWTREAILLRIQEWADDAGGIPPTAAQWVLARAGGDHSVPAVNHVQHRFGSWNAAIETAGFVPHPSGPVGGFRRLTTGQRRECARRYAAGESSTSIAHSFGCSPQVVTKWARHYGVEIRPAMFGRRAA